MSQHSHDNPEQYYQESIHRVPSTDAYREEQREEQYEIPDNADEVTGKNRSTVECTDAIKNILDCMPYGGAECFDISAKDVRNAQAELRALTERIAQIEKERTECGRGWYCGGKMRWNSDFNFEDYGMEGEGIVTELTCSKCDADATFYQKDEGCSTQTERE